MLPAFPHRPLPVRVIRGLSLVLLVALLVGAVGCGGGTKESANSVSGKVTLGNEKVSGEVVFVGSDNSQKGTPIKPDGTYVIADPPLGKVKVLVKGMGGPSKMAPPKDAPPMAGSGAEPPAKYGDVKTTDVEVEVKAGKQTIDIPLKS